MYFNVDKIFFDYWKLWDNPQAFPFFSVIQNDDMLKLIKNTLFQDRDIFTWISEEPVDFSVIKEHSTADRIVLNRASESNTLDGITNIPSSYKVSLHESAVIYENDNKVGHSAGTKYNIRKLIPDDVVYLSTLNYADMRHDYIQQTIDAYEYQLGEVYVLEVDNEIAGFVTVYDLVSSKLNYSYKMVDNLYSLPKYRGQSLAKQLIISVMGMFIDTPFMYVADSWTNEQSNRLAKSCGFNLVGYNQQILIQK